MLHTAYLLLGSNRGDRFSMLNQAKEIISEQAGRISRESSVFESVPWGFSDETNFLNKVICIETFFLPLDLLDLLMHIETMLGRTRNAGGYSSRLIDIDILFYDNIILIDENLTIPHPRLHKRLFTLLPLAEMTVELIHPVLHLTVPELLQQCEDKSDVWIFINEMVSDKS